MKRQHRRRLESQHHKPQPAGGWPARLPDGPGLTATTAATAVALLAGAIVLEAPQLTQIERARDRGRLRWPAGFVVTFAIVAPDNKNGAGEAELLEVKLRSTR